MVPVRAQSFERTMNHEATKPRSVTVRAGARESKEPSAPGEVPVKALSDGGSIPPTSTIYAKAPRFACLGAFLVFCWNQAVFRFLTLCIICKFLYTLQGIELQNYLQITTAVCKITFPLLPRLPCCRSLPSYFCSVRGQSGRRECISPS